ncbi:MAG: hypothetical protein AB7E32_10050 [Desulfovibrio sp.]
MLQKILQWILSALAVVILLFYICNSPFFWWLFDSDSLYAPIYTRPFNPYVQGATIEGELYERLGTEHAIMLSFDKGVSFTDELRAMQGRFKLELSEGKRELQRQDILLKRNMITCISLSNGAEKWLYLFELPIPGVEGPVHFKLTVIDPVTFPGGSQPPACCLVGVVYDPT